MDLPVQIPSKHYFTTLTILKMETVAQILSHLFLILGKIKTRTYYLWGKQNWTMLPSFHAAWKILMTLSPFFISHKYSKMPKSISGTIFILLSSHKVSVHVYILDLYSMLYVLWLESFSYYHFINVFIITQMLQFTLCYQI